MILITKKFPVPKILMMSWNFLLKIHGYLHRLLRVLLLSHLKTVWKTIIEMPCISEWRDF